MDRVRFESNCVGCSDCIGSGCPYSGESVYFICHVCGDDCEEGKLYKVDDEYTCEDCLHKMFQVDEDKEIRSLKAEEEWW